MRCLEVVSSDVYLKLNQSPEFSDTDNISVWWNCGPGSLLQLTWFDLTGVGKFISYAASKVTFKTHYFPRKYSSESWCVLNRSPLRRREIMSHLLPHVFLTLFLQERSTASITGFPFRVFVVNRLYFEEEVENTRQHRLYLDFFKCANLFLAAKCKHKFSEDCRYLQK